MILFCKSLKQFLISLGPRDYLPCKLQAAIRAAAEKGQGADTLAVDSGWDRMGTVFENV